MAAGDVTHLGDWTLGNGMAGDLRIMFGTVVLDGGNPTPVTLTNYLKSVMFGGVSINGSGAPASDPAQITCDWSAAVLNIYAWKPTAQGDTALVASTDNARVVNWMAIGPHV